MTTSPNETELQQLQSKLTADTEELIVYLYDHPMQEFPSDVKLKIFKLGLTYLKTALLTLKENNQ